MEDPRVGLSVLYNVCGLTSQISFFKTTKNFPHKSREKTCFLVAKQLGVKHEGEGNVDDGKVVDGQTTHDSNQMKVP